MAGRNIRRKQGQKLDTTRCPTCQGPIVPELRGDVRAVLVLIVTYDRPAEANEIEEVIECGQQYGDVRVARLSRFTATEEDFV